MWNIHNDEQTAHYKSSTEGTSRQCQGVPVSITTVLNPTIHMNNEKVKRLRNVGQGHKMTPQGLSDLSVWLFDVYADINLYHTIGTFSRQNIEILLLFFPDNKFLV